MSRGLIILIIVIGVLLVLGYVVAVLLRKRNEALLAALEERKEELYNLPVNDEVEAVKNMHLIGQSQVAFREWNQKWVDLSLNSFADIENNLFEAEGYNNSFRFLKAKQAIGNIESQVQLIDEDIKAIRQALSELKEKEEMNSGRVVHALDMFENLQKQVASDPDAYGPALPEIEKQSENIQVEFSKFVTLNSSGDPVEAAEILDTAENHIVALTHIVEKVPAIVKDLQTTLPDQLEDLESGYRKLLESGYHFTETDLEARFQQLHAALKANLANVAALELDNALYENEQIQEEINALYDIFTREIESHKVVEKLVKALPGYLAHAKENNKSLAEEVERLSKIFESKVLKENHLKELEAELTAQELVVEDALNDTSETQKAYSILQEELEAIEERLKEIEDDQIALSETLSKIEKDDTNARQKVNIYANRLHAIKRYMDKRNLPGIPQSFLTIFFTASDNTEALLAELEGRRVNIENVNRLLDILTNDMTELEEETYKLVQYATLTEQLLQYSNRYRSFDDHVQAAFDEALYIFEKEYDYPASFKVISEALETVEPGVTERFVSSYEKTRESIRF
ncbi:septation ring formation regulator EzrA [Streptococcus ilei]|jgi:septation ring formation regulator, ezrA|uniref:Septation ring formation regulator EzrA n=1 Tax=Streptococcus koreensis TaxID=2382163 RepID=A0ABM6ZAC7_9STRE|nr:MULTISPECIES: septation ring formation regulator EzrA [Streptococcus]AGY39999.1 septation ring formation regulator EzrA [Streptococcus ilei]AYF94259.1 septation ring formation regulator EzrA [Streptococcus koreensis]MCE3591090.1 septation ring formation regulator EzrA [Streptococcus sp. XMC]MDB8649545.1 septation ring formation regulator EzrA [Streptococcus australis]RJU24728.1 septation ring formation regulator EzrA [Streptococcus sp. AM43-2AT]